MSFFRYAIGGIVFYLANIVVMYIMVDWIKIHYLVATTIATIVFFIARYFLFEKYVFNKKKKKEQSDELGFFEKHWLTITVVIIFLIIMAALFYFTPYKIGTKTPWMK